MDKSSILKRIVQEQGNCCWAKPKVCAICPLSKLRQKQDGTWMSCVESVGIEGLTEEESDAKYLEIATRILVDDTIDDILGNNDVK